MAREYDISDFEIVRETEKAICIEVPVGYAKLNSHTEWVPKSQIDTVPHPQSCFADQKLIPEWPAGQIGIK